MEPAFLGSIFQEQAWTAVVLVASFAVLAALIGRAVARALLLRATNRAPMLRATVMATERAGAIAVPLAALQLVWAGAPDTLRGIGSVRHLSGLLLIAALTWLVMRVIAGAAQGVKDRNPVTVEDNLHARRIQTQTAVLARTAMVLVLLAGTAMALMTFPGARQLGASLLASAGVVGIIGGIAARPVFSNLIAGLQLAMAQPIRLDDVLIVNNEWGRVEEITGTYVVLALWDERRMIVPLQWFIENPFQNWTRSNSQLLGTVILYVDYATPVEPIRVELERVVRAAPEWDQRVCVLQVTDATEKAMQLRALVSARDAGKSFDLRCRVREALLAFIAREYPQHLPQLRFGGDTTGRPLAGPTPAPQTP